jgi:hypothetical protein
MRELLANEEREERLKTRAQSSFAEDMAYQMRDAVKEDTKDVLVHSLDRKKDKRRLYERG